MTPEDPPIPDDDAVAGAARRALGRLADDGVPVAPWDDVRARGRRTQRTRAAVAIAAALLVVVAGAAGVAAVRGKGDHVDVAGVDHGGTTTTTTEPPSSTTTTQLSLPPATNPGVVGTTPTIPPAAGSDLDGALTLGTAPPVADQITPYAITLRNPTDHVIRPPNGQHARVGIWVVGEDHQCAEADAADFSLGPREEHTYSASFTPTPESIGFVTIYAAYLYDMPNAGDCSNAGGIPGVDPITVFVVPPGYVAGQPLDPSIGKWNTTVTADATQVTVGSAVTLHATLQNTGTQDEPPHAAFASLAFFCQGRTNLGPYWRWGQLVDAATVGPGNSVESTATFLPESDQVGAVTCGVSLVFHDDPTAWAARPGITGTDVQFAVVAPEGSTTTTGP